MPLEAAEVLPKLVRGPLRDMKRDARRLGSPLDEDGLHRLRVTVKRARYAAELAAPVAGKKARRSARRLARLQGVLGDHNDAYIARGQLRGLAARTGLQGAWAAGLLGGLQLAHAADCRERFGAVWADATKAKHWRWVN